MAKRLLCVVLSLLMIMAVLPMGVVADTPEGDALTSTGGTLSSGSYYLSENTTLTTDITIASGATVTLDLNGYTLTGSGSASVITVNSGGTFTLKDSSSSGTGTITATATLSVAGGGVYVNGGTFTMESGTISGITIDRSSKNGAGVFVTASGSFTMYGGTITGNKAGSNSKYGGGVAVSGGATFIMRGGTISENEAYNGAGVYLSGYSSFEMYGGTISENTSTYLYGGGVYISTASTSTFTLDGGTITGNKAPYGGGVYSVGTFTMKSGTISENKSDDGYGGGVCVSGGSAVFNMTGGTISGNTATTYGGGVNVCSGIFNMSGGVITDNSANYGGGVGVYFTPTNTTTTATFNMTGGAIYSNTATTGAADVYAIAGVGSKATYVMIATITLPSSMTVDSTTYTWYTDASNSRYDADTNANAYTETLSSTTVSSTEPVCLIAVEEENVAVPTLYGKSLVLDTQIGVVYYYTFGDDFDEANLSNYTVKYTVGDSTKEVSLQALDGTDYYIAICSVYFYQMADSIDTEVCYNGTELGVTSAGYSVRKYYDNVYSGKTTLMADLLKAMLNYGGYGQQYIASLSSETVSDTDLANYNIESDLSSVTISDSYRSVTGGTDTTNYGASASVVISTTESCNIRFRITKASTSDYTVYINGNVATLTEGGYYEVSDILVQDWDEKYTFEIKSGDNTVYSVEYCVLSYAYGVLYGEGNEGQSDSLKSLVKAMYLYNVAADAYLNN